MTEEKAFEPITSQAEFDERIKARLAREREKWEKESGGDDLLQQLEAKDAEIKRLQTEHAVDWQLSSRGLDEGRVNRIKKLLDFEGDTHPSEQLEALSRDVPELFTIPRSAGSRGSSKPVLTQQEKPLTREDVEKMSREEINQNWDRVQGVLAGERG
jgi:hypothetical protein